MKEHKEVTISYDIVGDKIKNVKINGKEEDLVHVLSCGGENLFMMCISSVMHSYLKSPSRELFASNFFKIAHEFEEHAFAQMNKEKAS